MTSIVLALALLAAAPENPADLADRLGSADAGVREEAEGALEEIGRPALPVLRIAVGKASDPAHARRLAELIDLIERKRLLSATQVELVEHDVTVSDAVADLSRRARLRVTLDPPDDPHWTSKKIEFDSKGPIGFWEAIDRLGTVGGFRLEAIAGWYGSRTEPTVRLVRFDDPPAKTSYAGPFRVDLASLNRHRAVTQTRPGITAKPVDDFSVMLNLVPEPGLKIARNGSPRVFEAVDARGADLRPTSTLDPSAQNEFPFRQWRPEGLGAITYRLPLRYPAARGGTLKRLRGELPISVVARTGPIMTVPLDGSEGRPFTAGGITLIVRAIERSVTGPFALTISVRGESPQLTPPIAPGPRQLTLGPIHPGYHPDDHIQILDSLGRTVQITSNIPPPRPDGTLEFRVQIHAYAPSGPATTLRYYGLVGEATEIPFEFVDVPLP
jgi:hypothetical protein